MVTVELLTTNAYLLHQGFTGEDRQLETAAERVKEEQQLEPYKP